MTTTFKLVELSVSPGRLCRVEQVSATLRNKDGTDLVYSRQDLASGEDSQSLTIHADASIVVSEVDEAAEGIPTKDEPQPTTAKGRKDRNVQRV